MRVTHAHPLNPAALAFVPFGIVLVRVRVRLIAGSAKVAVSWFRESAAETVLQSVSHSSLCREVVAK